MISELKKFSLRGGIVLALAVLSCTSVYAQRANDRESEEPVGTIDPRTGEILAEAIEFLNMEQYVEARARLGDLRVDRLSPFEKSRFHQLMFNLEMTEEDYPAAREQLQLAIDSGGLNPQELSALRYQVAQLFVQEEKYAEAATALETWIASEPMPNSGAYYLLSASYYYQELFDKALPNAQKAVDLAGDTPQEPWMQMLASLLIQKEDFDAAIPVLKRMVNLYGDKNYWEQLSGLYMYKEDYTNALVVLELANHSGLVTEDREIRQLADLYMVQEMPYRAATMLEEAIDEGNVDKDQEAYEKLGNAWAAAAEYEKAVPVLRDAANLAEDGELYLRAGQVQQQLNDWEGSVESFEDALEKGNLREEAYVQYLAGYSLYELERYDEATTFLRRAARDDDRREDANNLIRVIESRRNN